jgi:hypothetical protein
MISKEGASLLGLTFMLLMTLVRRLWFDVAVLSKKLCVGTRAGRTWVEFFYFSQLLFLMKLHPCREMQSHRGVGVALS